MDASTITIVVLLLSGCGRVRFADEQSTDAASDSSRDSGSDAASLPLCDRFVGELVCETFDGGHSANVTGSGVAEPQVSYDGDGWRFDTPPAGNKSLYHLIEPQPTFGGALYLGGRMKIDAGPPVSNYIVLVQLLSPTFEKISFDDGGNDRPQVVSTVGGNTNTMFGATGSFPRDRWFCFELRVFISDTVGSTTLLIDGAPIVTWTGVDTLPIDGVSRVEVGGLASASNTSGTVVHIDNWVVTGGQEIGCP